MSNHLKSKTDLLVDTTMRGYTIKTYWNSYLFQK